jgi:hypothetical protein
MDALNEGVLFHRTDRRDSGSGLQNRIKKIRAPVGARIFA